MAKKLKKEGADGLHRRIKSDQIARYDTTSEVADTAVNSLKKTSKSPFLSDGQWLISLTGIFVMLAVSLRFATYVRQLHENSLWFSHIKVRLLYSDNVMSQIMNSLNISISHQTRQISKQVKYFTPQPYSACVCMLYAAIVSLPSLRIPLSSCRQKKISGFETTAYRRMIRIG